MVEAVFGLRSAVVTDPVSGTPLMVPVGRHHTVLHDTAPHDAAAVG
jgi:iron complex transport system ATP-binding protein